MPYDPEIEALARVEIEEAIPTPGELAIDPPGWDDCLPPMEGEEVVHGIVNGEIPF